jgi:hypothetical protein
MPVSHEWDAGEPEKRRDRAIAVAAVVGDRRVVV